MRRTPPLLFVGKDVALVGDGVEQAGEDRRMSGVRSCIRSLRILPVANTFLAATTQKWFGLPLFMNLRDVVKMIFSWGEQPEKRQASNIAQMIDQACAATKAFGNGLLLLGCYFLSVPALKQADAWNRAEAPKSLRCKGQVQYILQSYTRIRVTFSLALDRNPIGVSRKSPSGYFTVTANSSGRFIAYSALFPVCRL